MVIVKIEITRPELAWHEILLAAFDTGWMAPFNVEWLIDQAERGEWSGVWW